MITGKRTEYIINKETGGKSIYIYTSINPSFIDNLFSKNYNWYKVSAGENIYSISKKHYGSSKYWQYIAYFNSILPYQIEPGMTIGLPIL